MRSARAGQDQEQPVDVPALEVCVEDVDGALAAEEGGAARIELCADLAVGGVSPGPELLRRVRAAVRLPIAVMVRPRAGDFVASAAELARMEEELRSAGDAGAQAVVLGVLDADGRVDERGLARLVGAAAGLPVTFHRAFDETPDAAEALEVLVAHGVRRVLSSGHAPDVSSGAEALSALVRQAAGRIVVMPGGGLRAAGAAALRRRVGASEYHSSVWGSGRPSAGAVRELAEALRGA